MNVHRNRFESSELLGNERNHIMEKIFDISFYSEDGWEGYAIYTNKQTIKLLIQGGQQCCEEWGYFLSEDDFEEFIGADLLDIKITDRELKEGKLKEHDVNIDTQWFYGGILFVDLITSKGTLQFVAYNDHNGYYGHDAMVISEQLKYKETL